MAHLVHLAGLFGINENRARVALSRMVAAGEVDDRRGGPVPAGRAPARASGRARTRAGRAAPGPWTGEWRMVGGDHPGARPRSGPARRKRLAPGPPGRAARRGLAAARQHRPPSRPRRRSRPRALFGRARRRPGERWPPSLWDLDGWAAARRAPARPARRASRPPRSGRPGRRASSCPPRCSVTCRPIRCCPPSCCRASGRVARCGTPTTGGTGGTGRSCGRGDGRLRRSGPVRRVGLRSVPQARPAAGGSRRGPEASMSERTASGNRERTAVRRPGGGDHRRGPRSGPEPRGRARPARGRHRGLRSRATTSRRSATRSAPPNDLAETVRLVEEHGRRCDVVGDRRTGSRRDGRLRRPASRRCSVRSTSWWPTPESPRWARSCTMDARQWSETIDTNLTGVFNAIRAAAPHMRRQTLGPDHRDLFDDGAIGGIRACRPT